LTKIHKRLSRFRWAERPDPHSELNPADVVLTLQIQGIEASRRPNRLAGHDDFHALALGTPQREDVDG
jgi:hypothetical protein